jgi:hypothetical protein
MGCTIHHIDARELHSLNGQLTESKDDESATEEVDEVEDGLTARGDVHQPSYR